MRRLVQPGPPPPDRIVSFAGACQEIAYDLRPGLTLNEALTAPLVAAGIVGAAINFTGARLGPFAYVIPHPSPDADHVAYFSPARRPSGETKVEIANATFGWRDGAPFVHVHGVWTEADGSRRGGHMLPHETMIAASGPGRAWGSSTVAIEVSPDAETNFSLFCPVRHSGTSTDSPAFVLARIRPNEDFVTAVENICRHYGFAAAEIRASLGSLVGACFTDGRRIDDIATEVLVTKGVVHPETGRTQIELIAVDMAGNAHRGVLARGENSVCITFEVAISKL